MTSFNKAASRPYRVLLATFVSWKLFLLALSLGAYLAGDAYDTSAALAVQPHDDVIDHGSNSGPQHPGLAYHVVGLITRLASWDAIYFTSIARRGYRIEQEWAFGAGLPGVVRGLLGALEYVGILSKLDPSSHGALRETLAALFVTNTSHIFSVFFFYHLTITLWPNRPFFALTSSVLHIFSPAGLFLSAPYAESCFAALAFAGWLLLARSCRSEDNALLRDTYIVLAGVVFGLATVFRSNGVLNGIPFAWEMVRLLPRLGHRPVDTMRRLLALGVGGVCVALGSVVPQAVAWMRFCSDGVGDVRPWCKAYLPSIYAFVQKYYWGVGFLQYWRLPNLPLFLLAAPMITIMLRSATNYLTQPQTFVSSKPAESARLLRLIQSTAAAQAMLAVLAVTNYHVQIITRISSGYPLWYWWVAEQLSNKKSLGHVIIVFMIMYASIQGVLFASFLPPA